MAAYTTIDDPSDGGGSSFDSAAKDFLAICTKNLGSDGG